MDLQHKSLPFAIKAMGGDGPGTFELYAAVFNNVDVHRDVILPGAFKNLDAFVRDGWGAVNHCNWSDDLGVATVDAAEQDSVGLRVKGTFHSTADAQAKRTIELDTRAAALDAQKKAQDATAREQEEARGQLVLDRANADERAAKLEAAIKRLTGHGGLHVWAMIPEPLAPPLRGSQIALAIWWGVTM